jgi:hypothetical protein
MISAFIAIRELNSPTNVDQINLRSIGRFAANRQLPRVYGRDTTWILMWDSAKVAEWNEYPVI